MAVQHVIDKTFLEIDEVYNKWNPQSEISRINALPAQTPHILSPSLARFLEKTDVLVKLSGGRFDPTVEPLQQLWKDKLMQGKIPSIAEVEGLRPCIGWHTLHLSNGILIKKEGATKLDLGGIAKGYCVDLLIERLHQLGLDHLYVEWGGEIRTLGRHPSGRPWRVFITRLGNPDPAHALATIELVDSALATSGDYFQNWTITTREGAERSYCHVFNPHTLSPLEVKPGSIASASLLAPDCMTADALAKVLMLFDTQAEAMAWFEELQQRYPLLALACWIDDSNSH